MVFLYAVISVLKLLMRLSLMMSWLFKSLMVVRCFSSFLRYLANRFSYDI